MSRVAFHYLGGVRGVVVLTSFVLFAGGCASTPPSAFPPFLPFAPASDPSSPEGQSAGETASLVALGTSWLVPPIAGAPSPEAMSAAGTPAPPKARAANARFACPMHPEEVSDHAGRCSKCGMDLVAISPLEVDADAEKKP